MTLKNKCVEFIEGYVVAEIFEKIRERDGKHFYDVVINRRYHDDKGDERRTEFLQLRDLESLHILAVKARRHISQLLYEARNSSQSTSSQSSEEYMD